MRKIGLIPAAGKGSRLGLPFSKELYPLPFHNDFYPVILSNLLAFKTIGIDEIILVVSAEKSDIIKYIGNGSKWDLKICYVIIEFPISLPDSLAHAYNLMKNKEVYFLMADTLIENNDFLIEFNKNVNTKYKISLGCFYTDNPSKFATLTMKNGIVDFCEEKNPGSRSNIMWGFWRWNPSFSRQLIKSVNSYKLNSEEQTMSEIIQEDISNGFVQGIVLEKYKYWDLGTFDEINKFINSKLIK